MLEATHLNKMRRDIIITQNAAPLFGHFQCEIRLQPTTKRGFRNFDDNTIYTGGQCHMAAPSAAFPP